MGLAQRRFVVVTGKGGVGKTTVSAALALALARRGRRTLIAMLQAPQRLASLLGVPRIGPRNAAILPGIDAVNMTPEASLEQYGIMTLRFRTLYRLVFENRVVRAFLSAIPGLDAWAMLGKATYHAVERNGDGRFRYDTVILDAPATGHVLTLLSVPRAVVSAAPPGPLRRDAQERWDLLTDPERSEVLPVTILEEMPVHETAELVGSLRADLGLPVRRIVVNATPPTRFTRTEIDRLERDGVPPDAGPLLAAARLDLDRSRHADEQHRQLRDLVDLPTLTLPLVGHGRLRRADVETLADHLEPVL